MRKYLTNMDRRLWGLVAAAIESSGRLDIHMDPWPMPATGETYSEFVRDCMMDRYFSIYVDDTSDCSDFWAEYERLKNTDYWRIFLMLSTED